MAPKKHVNTEYLPQAIVSKTVLDKITGNITDSCLDEGIKIGSSISHFNKYVQIIDGSAELTINDISYTLIIGQGILIPANSNYIFSANQPFKMIAKVIKSGYEI